MKLNGWQRLWTVLSVAWLCTIVTIAIVSWPRPSEFTEDETRPFIEAIPDDALRARLTADENALLKDPNELWVGKVGGKIQNPYRDPDPSTLPNPRVFDGGGPSVGSSGSGDDGPAPKSMLIPEFARLVKQKYPELAHINDDVVVADVLALYPVYRGDIDPRALAAASDRYDRMIAAQEHAFRVSRSFAAALVVHTRRLHAVAVYAIVALLPPVVLYMFGWSFGWIRRGFHSA